MDYFNMKIYSTVDRNHFMNAPIGLESQNICFIYLFISQQLQFSSSVTYLFSEQFNPKYRGNSISDKLSDCLFQKAHSIWNKLLICIFLSLMNKSDLN